MFDDREAVVAALTSVPDRNFERQESFPLEIPVTVFSGYYGFGPRADRRPLPLLGLSGLPLFAHFERPDRRDPHGVSKMAVRFETDEAASFAVATLRQQARQVLIAQDAPDLADLEPISLGDEFVWGWQMTVQTKQEQRRTDFCWRRGCWMINLASWSRGRSSNDETIEMAMALDSELAAG